MSELFISLIMTPCNYPDCFAGIGPFSRICFANGININVLSNAFGRFLTRDHIRFMYICGSTHAELFFRDLLLAFSVESEVLDYHPREFSIEGGKKIFLNRDFNYEPATLNYNHIVVRLKNSSAASYRNFSRSDLAAFVYCGNTEDGPIDFYRCVTNDICVGGPTSIVCDVCELVSHSGRLSNYPRFHILDFDQDDEGCVVEPLGVPANIFKSHFESTF